MMTAHGHSTQRQHTGTLILVQHTGTHQDCTRGRQHTSPASSSLTKMETTTSSESSGIVLVIPVTSISGGRFTAAEHKSQVRYSRGRGLHLIILRRRARVSNDADNKAQWEDKGKGKEDREDVGVVVK